MTRLLPWVLFDMAIIVLGAATMSTNTTAPIRLPSRHVDNVTFRTNVTCDRATRAVVFVCSAASHFRHRDVIRNTWASQLNETFRVFFLVGVPYNKTDETKIHEEYEEFMDILQINVRDTYHNLAYKTIAVLKWVTEYCLQVKYVIKVDDDVFLNIPQLENTLGLYTDHQNFILGRVITQAEPVRDPMSKLYASESSFSQSEYPPYVSGCAYVISGDAVTSLYRMSRDTEVFHLEDVFLTGLVAQKAGTDLIDTPRLGYHYRGNNLCVYKLLIAGHRVSPEEMMRIWKMMTNKNLRCDYVNRLRGYHG